jgi:hypothetical protein
VPLSTGARLGAANALRDSQGASISAPVAAAPFRRRRRVTTGPERKEMRCAVIVRLPPA